MDRNGKIIVPAPAVMVSLSARRAWIEIKINICYGDLKMVALRKESVDRNAETISGGFFVLGVALRKESVDRNFHYNLNLPSKPSRSPQGERG